MKCSLEQLCKESPLYTDAHLPMLNKELKIIGEQHYEEAFLRALNLVNYAKETGIAIGPGKLSMGTSLVNYLLGITFFDPMQFDLDSTEFFSDENKDLLVFVFDVSEKNLNRLSQYMEDCRKQIGNIKEFMDAFFYSAYLDYLQDSFPEPLFQLYNPSSYVWTHQRAVMKFIRDNDVLNHVDKINRCYQLKDNLLIEQILEKKKLESISDLASVLCLILVNKLSTSDALNLAILIYLGAYVKMRDSITDVSHKRLFRYYEKLQK